MKFDLSNIFDCNSNKFDWCLLAQWQVNTIGITFILLAMVHQTISHALELSTCQVVFLIRISGKGIIILLQIFLHSNAFNCILKSDLKLEKKT